MNLTDTAMIFGGMAGGAAATIAVLTPALRRAGRIEHGVATIWRAVLGTPAEGGQPAQPGVMERFSDQDQHLATQDTQLAEIRAELGKLKGQ